MAIIEAREQCKGCFHFQVCADVLKHQLFIREKMLKEENLKCENYIPASDVSEVVRCKDCIYWHSLMCCKLKFVLGGIPGKEDYCSFGRRIQNKEVD